MIVFRNAGHQSTSQQGRKMGRTEKQSNRKKMSIGVNKLTEKETEVNIQKNQKKFWDYDTILQMKFQVKSSKDFQKKENNLVICQKKIHISV